jgi:exonuclease III
MNEDTQPGKADLLVRELNKYHINVCGMAEIKWRGHGCKDVDGWSIHYSGSTDGSVYGGVGLALSRNMGAQLIQIQHVSNRLMYGRLQLPGDLRASIVVSYAPTDISSDEDKDQFYSDLAAVMWRIPDGDMRIVLGDFNAQVGSEVDVWPGVIGSHGVGSITDNGTRLLSFCSVHKLTVMGTCFEHKRIHKVTWHSPKQGVHTQIDHILISQAHRRYVFDTRVYRGADVGSDHSLVVSDMCFRVGTVSSRSKPRFRKYDSHLLISDLQLRHQFQLELRNHFSALPEESSGPEEEWEAFKGGVNGAAQLVLQPVKRAPRNSWISADTLDLVQSKSKAHLRVLRKPLCSKSKAAYRGLNNRVKKAVQHDKEQEFKQFGKDFDGAMMNQQTRAAYRMLNSMTGRRAPPHPQPCIKDEHGNPIMEKGAQLKRWADYHKGVLNSTSYKTVIPTSSIILHHIPIPKIAPPAFFDESPPQLKEVEDAIKTLKNHKSPSPEDNITAEMLKAGGWILTQWLHRVLVAAWSTTRAPSDFKRAAIINIYKKGDRMDCTNYRGISLLSVPGKVYTVLILGRVKSLLDAKLLEHQAGFRPGRSCADQIFTLRNLMSISKSDQQPLYMCFIDLQKAYDTVNRTYLWLVLEQYGIPSHLLELLRDLHTGTEAHVRVGGEKSEWFSIDQGVRQGCVIAPMLFNMFMDFVVRHALHTFGSDRGVEFLYRIGKDLFPSRKSNEDQFIPLLLYADDLVLLSTNRTLLHDMIYHLEAWTQRWGLTISVPKTKILSSSWDTSHEERVFHIQDFDSFDDHDDTDRDDDPLVVRLRGEQVGSVDHFSYLGSFLSSDGSLDKEISNRISKAAASFSRLANGLWNNSHISRSVKLCVYRSVVLPILLYGAETWTALKSHTDRLNVFHMACLRCILCVSRRDKVSNKSILLRCKLSHISTLVQLHRLRWFGHVCRMDNRRFAKQSMFATSCGGEKKRGGQAKQWKSFIRSDLAAIKQQYSWSSAVQNRSGWRGLLKTHASRNCPS